MKFFQIAKSKRPKIVGCYPQEDGILASVSIDDPRYIGRRFFEPLPMDVVIPNAVLDNKAKLTDLVSAMTLGFTLNLLISERTYQLIADHITEGLEFHQTYVVSKEEEKHSFFLVYPRRNCSEMLDYTNCEFSISSVDAFNGEKLQIRSSEEFDYKFDSLRMNGRGTIRIDKLALAKNIDCDMFCLGQVALGAIGYFISDQLRISFEKNGLTGFEYVLVN